VDSTAAQAPGSTHATRNWQEAIRLEKELIRIVPEGSLPSQGHSIKLFAAIDVPGKKATANRERAVNFDRERLDVVCSQHVDARRRSEHVRRRAPGRLNPGSA
jgi:hypothetical protein